MLLVSMHVPRSAAQVLLLGAVALLIALAAAPPAGAAARCFGAAARDLEHPCFNPQLLKAVAPRPIAALLETDAPCDPFDRAWPISVCWFGRVGSLRRQRLPTAIIRRTCGGTWGSRGRGLT